MSALVQASTEVDDEAEPDRRTTARRPLDERSGPERETVEVLALEAPALEAPAPGSRPEWARSTVQMRPLPTAPRMPPPEAPKPLLARGSAPIPRPRVARRSCEILRIEDINPDGAGGGRRRKPTQ
ncbi:MAG TPA: hypothetical protein VK932_21845 [Kofleriaceae bacterium]|nr:hypothetical protein [Kofleriaceae bacterium]